MVEKIFHLILEWCETPEELDEKEIYYIDLYKSKVTDNGYNISDGGFVPRLSGELNPARREDVRKKISDKLTGRIITDEWREKIRQTCIDNEASLSCEQRIERSKKLSEACSGGKNGMYGKHHSLETLKKLSDIKKANPRLYQSPEEREKRSKTLTGHVVSQATREKLREYNLNKVYITNGVDNKTVLPDCLNEWLEKGWVVGRTKKIRPKCVLVNNLDKENKQLIE